MLYGLIGWVLWESIWGLYNLHWVFAVMAGIITVLILFSIHTVRVPHSPLTMFLVTWWEEWDFQNPQVKAWGTCFIVPYWPVMWSGVPLNVSIRDFDVTIDAFTKRGVEAKLPFEVNWQAKLDAHSLMQFHMFTSDARSLYPGDPDPRGKKVQNFLVGRIGEVARQKVSEIETFEELITARNGIAQEVDNAVDTAIGQFNLGIQALLVNLKKPEPSAEYKKDMEQREVERLQQAYEQTQQDTVNLLVQKAATSSGTPGKGAYDRVMVDRAKEPAAYAQVVTADANRDIATAVKDGLVEAAKTIADAFKKP